MACHSRQQAEAVMLSWCAVLHVLGAQQDLSYDGHRKLKGIIFVFWNLSGR